MRGNSYVPFMLKRGDGSTLSLDFTSMGELDSRFTFSRSSTATVINSSGLVQYADHNLVANSAFAGSGMGTGWTQNGAAATNSGTGTLTFSVTTAAVSFASRSIATTSGLRYSATVNVSSITGTIQYQEILAIGGTISSTQMYRNGVTVSASATAQPGLISITWTSGGSNFIRFGIGASGNNQTNVTVAVDAPRAIAGEATQPVYFASTASDPYHAPRFDYNPSTLAPRGLLIEGSATNLCLNGSMAYTATAPTNWIRAFSGCTVASVDSTTFPGQKAWSISATASGQRDFLEQTISLAANTTYTVSVYLEAVTGTTATFAYMTALPAGATSGTVANPSAGRVTFSVTVGATAGTGTLRVGIGTAAGTGVSADASVRFSHVQVEAGSGASSYIPTGASTVQRAADSCALTGTYFSSWFSDSSGTMLVAWSGTGAVDGRFATINNTAATNQIWLGASDSAVYNGSFQASFGSALTANQKVVIAYAANDAAWCLAGSAVSTDASVVLPTGLNRITVGNSHAGTAPINTALRSLKFWPTRLPNATLQSLTQ